MTEYAMGESNGELNVPQKDFYSERSPRSPLTTQSPGSDSLDLAIEGAVETSLEQLYYNVCEMQSSDNSPSRQSFVSYGEESRIDSELRFLAGGDYGAPEVMGKNDEETTKGEDCTPAGIKVSDDENKNEPSTPGSTLRFGSEANKKATLKSKTPKGRPPNGKQVVKNMKNVSDKSSLHGGNSLQHGTDQKDDRGNLGQCLLKQAKEIMSSGDNTQKALALSLRAKKIFEVSGDDSPNLDYVSCLHVVSALYCSLGQYDEAIPILERSIDIANIDLDHTHALAKFAGCMQLGDTYAMLGQIENSIIFYTAGLEIQCQVLGEKDPRYAETCRYLAEAHVQAMQFDEALKLCERSLAVHKENGSSASPQEAADRRLLGLIYDAKGDHQGALENYVLASMAMAANGQSEDVASIECNIGDAYLSLARYDEAIFAYQKALNMLKARKGENDLSVASVFVRLADLYNKIGKFTESKSYCEDALHIYSKPIQGTSLEEIASGLVDISVIYESANEHEKALELLHKALEDYGKAPGQQSIIIGIEAQMGVLHFILGNYSESYTYLKNATSKFRAIGEKKTPLFGIALNQMGLACVQLLAIKEAANLFEESRRILEEECGPYHPDTLAVYSNLAGAYDALGRTADAVDILEHVVELREEKLGTADPIVEDEKRRLDELLKESGLMRRKKSRSLETLFAKNTRSIKPHNVRAS